ncbi:transposon Tn21 resolvase (plasmid) [Escherichia coli]|nr:transposon Tn21 resolvase [Escherichia coli]
MTGQRIGYIRVSTFDQNPERQLEGVKVDRAFSDKASGKDVKRPQLEALISFARTGDTVVVHSMDRLARNLDDLRRIVQTLTQRGGTVAKLAMRQPFVLFKGLTFQKLCLPGAFRPGDHHNKMLRPGLCVVHASPQYL